MIEEQRERLKNNDSEYLSIGITDGGLPRSAIGVPWNFTSNAYSMMTPNVYIAKEDLNDEQIMAEILKYKVIGCYISVPLDDYSFLKSFVYLRDLAIKNGHKMSDVSFMRELHECRMLYLHGVHLSNLDDVIETKKLAKTRYVYCLCINDCQIDDISSVLENERLGYSEFIVITSQGSGEKQRWEGFKRDSRHLHVYEYVPKDK